MLFLASDINDFINKVADKKIVCFGASKHLFKYAEKHGYPEWLKQIEFFVDNDMSKQGTFFELGEYSWIINNPQILVNIKNDTLILITTGLVNVGIEICNQLQKMSIGDDIECYAMLQMEMTIRYDDTAVTKFECAKCNKIPKVIHSFWFSGDEKPGEYIECINSWKKYCPDYEIVEWNLETYDVTKNKYMYDAYKNKKWAFVSDYARLDVVYNYGGVYMDMDVEVLKSLDELLKFNSFYFFDNSGYVDLGSGFGAQKGDNLVGKLLNAYDNIDFNFEVSEILDIKVAVPQPTLLLPIFEEYGYSRNLKSQIVDNNVFLSPDYCKVIGDSSHKMREIKGTEYAIHWHHAGWFDEKLMQKRENRIKNMQIYLDYFKNY